jgi:hypothetical protein
MLRVTGSSSKHACYGSYTALSKVPATKLLEEATITKNNVAMSQLNQALITDADKGLIYKASTDRSNGLACKEVELLIARYSSRDTTLLLELKQEVKNVTMTDHEELAAMFGHILKIKNRYNAPEDTMTNSDLMSVALKAAPEKYCGALLSLQTHVSNVMPMDLIKAAITNYYRIDCGSNARQKNAARKTNKNTGAEGKYQLAAVNKNKNACWDCGKPVHKEG